MSDIGFDQGLVIVEKGKAETGKRVMETGRWGGLR